MTAAKLLAVGAVVETVTGIALIAVPEMVARLLFGAGIQPAGAAIGRVAGLALLALGFAWWPGAGRVHQRAPLRALLAYNLLVAIFFLYLGIGGTLVGRLLWFAVAFHSVMTVLLVRAWPRSRCAADRPRTVSRPFKEERREGTPCTARVS